MPKKQPTAAKRARAAARSGAKYTPTLRREQAHDLHLPHYLEAFDEQILSDDERLVVDHLRTLAAENGPLPVRVVRPEPEGLAAQSREEATGRTRWASVEAAVDGYVLRETMHGPNRPGSTTPHGAPHVPVPIRAKDGSITVLALPEWAREHEGRWIWAHTGWPIETPGRLVDPPQVFSPAAELCWEVAVWVDPRWEDGKGIGEDYDGVVSEWQTVGWCTTREDARQIALAFTAHRGPYARAEVLEHGSDRGVASLTRGVYRQSPDAPERPRRATEPGPRPASPDRRQLSEPVWHSRLKGVPHPESCLLVWTGEAWKALVWTSWQSHTIAAVLGVGAGGPYAWAQCWGPRYPDQDMFDWTQEGRELRQHFPDMSFDERSQRIEAARCARENALVNALAARGNLTVQQAMARLQRGGSEYRQFLSVGQAAISRALNTARRALPEGPERTAIRHTLDDLTDCHLLPANAEHIANRQLDGEIEASRAHQVTAWCRRAVTEYTAPAADPVAAGVDGFPPAADRRG